MVASLETIVANWLQEFDLRNKESIEESVRHSDIVYNLIGRDYPTKNFHYDDVNVWGASRIAEAVAKYDVDRFVHVSSHSVSKDSPSEFLRTKALGEEVVRSIYPEATIVRPAPCYGSEDRFLNLLASPNYLFTSNSLKQRVWPVHAIDVGRALEQMLYDDSTASNTFELYGPQRYSMQEVAQLVDREIVKKRQHYNIPKAIRKPILNLLNKAIFWHVGSPDEVEREFIDQFIDPEAKTFADLGMEPAVMENLMFEYLVSGPKCDHDQADNSSCRTAAPYTTIFRR
jgi:NADH dehydrogenase (ubiquinone) 1 alpha subcomplex subunit 9